MRQFENAKDLGSLIQPCAGETDIAFARGIVEARNLGSNLFLHETHMKVLQVLQQAEMLTQRYQVVVANPPYMGVGAMNSAIKRFGKDFFALSKSDLFAMFIERSLSLVLKRGAAALVTMHGWMFLSTFSDLRIRLAGTAEFASLVHIGPHGFDSIGGEVVQTAAFVLDNKKPTGRSAPMIRLVEGRSEAQKVEMLVDALETVDSKFKFSVSQRDLEKVPGSPIAYWVSNDFRRCFELQTGLEVMALFRQGMSTTDPVRFEREWHEVSASKFNLDRVDPIMDNDPAAYWYPFNKGGSKRRWFGNMSTVVRYERNGQDLLDLIVEKYPRISDPEFVIKNRKYFFLPSVTYASMGTGSFVARDVPSGCVYSVAGPAIFPKNWDKRVLLALLCAVTTTKFLEAINPTLGFQIIDIGKIPFSKELEDKVQQSVRPIANECVSIATVDWNNFENSWNFSELPLLNSGLKLESVEASWRNWQQNNTAYIRRMRDLETENNRVFIEAYELQNELMPEVSEDQVTLARADAKRDMASFLSYAVGCMMGRYSLDRPELILADAGDGLAEYVAKVGCAMNQLTFPPDEDGIIPVLDGDWFADDIVARTREFLRATFCEAMLRENIRFIEESLGRELRAYFLTDFYKDHLQTYKKRPIYWMVQSPRKGFSVLIYGQVQVTGRISEWVERAYLNNFLLPLADRWSDQVRRLDVWQCESLKSQKRFFEIYVKPFLARGQKVFVIVSDALRFEAAADFASRLQAANRWTADVDALLGTLPSYTQLGMASLMPGEVWAVNAENATVTVDGRSATGTANRAEILRLACDGKATALQSEDFLEMNSKTEGRALMRDHEVIYIFHNVIDNTGDKPRTEAKTFDAVEQAFDELELIIKKVANINGSNMLLTADHGFLFQQDDVRDDDMTPLPQASVWTYQDRRFAIGRDIAEVPAVKVFSAMALGVVGDWSVAFPVSLRRMPLQGSGKRYVHGGISLQEVVIPVVKIHKARNDDTAKVEVELTHVPAKITTGQISISLFQDRPALDKTLPRTLRIGLYSKDDKLLSEVKTHTFDSSQEEARQREIIVLLTLSRVADAFNNRDVYLRLEETVHGTNQVVLYKTHKLKLQKPFASDFDEL
jgi:hypothetical protein